MAKSDEASKAAGQAAYDQAGKSHWPPTKGDVQLIGAAAGAAAGTVLGGPVGAVIGTAVGEFVGGVAYDLINAIPNAGANPGAEYLIALNKIVAAYSKSINNIAETYNLTPKQVVDSLHEWGWKFDDSTGAWRQKAERYGPPAAMQALDQNRKEYFRAASAVIAEYESGGKPSSSSPAKAVAVVGGLGILLWLARKAILKI